MASLGHIALVAAFALAVYGLGASFVGARRSIPALVASGRNAAIGVTLLFTLAAGALLVAFLLHDYSIRYVFDHASRDMPLDLVAAAFYSGQQGSLLYWAWTLSLFMALVLWQQRHPGPHKPLIPYVVAVLLGIEAFMGLILGFVVSPFEKLPFTPPDGVGLNPLLYDEGMRIHPPMLLAGYMAWSVPFAFAIAALLSGRLNSEWLVPARRYAMFAWLILGLGNLLGAWWAYRVLGWGGFWGWDPVENVAIMPWLTGTAFIHSAQIQERRGMLKGWNVALILVTFFLSIFGTFIVRSGVLASVHSFAQSGIGPYFLAYLAAVIVCSVALFLWRLPHLRADNQLDSLLSREASFLLNNLLFVGITFAIFWGTIYPLMSEMLGQGKITVGPPYFQQTTGPLLGGVLLFMGIAPLMPWRRASRENLAQNFLAPVTGALGVTLILFIFGIRHTAALVGFALCLFVLGTILQEFIRGAAARHRGTGENYLAALRQLIRRNNRRYGGYIVHLGVILVGAGALAAQSYQVQTTATLAPGESVEIGGYQLTFQGLQTYTPSGSRVVEAPLLLNGELLRPQKVFFKNFERQPSTKVAIRSTPLEDLYIVLTGWDTSGPTSRASLLLFVNPLVPWIWSGGLFVLAGTVLALWPAPRLIRQAVVSPAAVRQPLARVIASLLFLFVAGIAAIVTPNSALAQPKEDEVRHIAGQLQCPVCEGQTVADSNSGLAQDMRAVIRERLDIGESEPGILDQFVASYGDSILVDTPKRGFALGLWIGPLVLVSIGGVLLAVLLGGWRGRRVRLIAPAGPAEETAVMEEFRRFRENFGQ